MENFNFNFDDDEPKKKKKIKKNKKKNKIIVQTRELYETKITQLNARLSSLRKHFVVKNGTNRQLAQELTTIEEDRVDVCEFLDRTIKDRRATIIELHSTFKNLENQRDEYKEWSQQRIIDLQKQYTTDHNQLQSELILQRKTLESLHEFRLKRNAALSEFETYNNGISQLARQVKDDLFNIEQKAVIQKNVLKKDVEDRFTQLVADFMHSYEIRNAGYTRNLIQENIVLTKRMDKMVKQNIRIMEEREKQYLKTKEIMESYTSLEQLTEQLRRTIENKSDIIDQLTARIDRMRMKYIDARRYRRLHGTAKLRGLFDKNGPKNFDDVFRFLERLNNAKNAFIEQQRVQQNEMELMHDVLGRLQYAVQTTLIALQQLGPGECLDPTDRRAMINELIYLMVSESLNDENDSKIYSPGACGFIIPENRLDEFLEVLYFRTKSKSKEELLAKCDAPKLPKLEQKKLSNEQIGDGPKMPLKIHEIKENLEKAWLQLELPENAITTAGLFDKCLNNEMKAKCDSNFSTSTTDLPEIEQIITNENLTNH